MSVEKIAIGAAVINAMNHTIPINTLEHLLKKKKEYLTPLPMLRQKIKSYVFVILGFRGHMIAM